MSNGTPGPCEIVVVERAPQGVSLRWNTTPETRYQILFRRDLPSSPDPIAVATAIGTETTYLDEAPLRVGQSAGFYWVLEIPTTPDP